MAVVSMIKIYKCEDKLLLVEIRIYGGVSYEVMK